MILRKKLPVAWEIVIIILLCFITRLPQLLSPLFVADGDECIVGLMAKHLYEGKEVPVFFMGQNYGFSLVEAGMSALAFVFGGVNDYSMKLAMLVLWTTGVVFLYKALRQMAGAAGRLPFLITLVFILSPAWAVWSMKARGGYLTSFACTNIILWLLYSKKREKRSPVFFVVGMLLVVVYESQSLWLAGLLPFVIYIMVKDRDMRRVYSLLAGIVVALLPFLYLQHTAPHFWKPNVFTVDTKTVASNLHDLPANVFSSLHGNYYLWNVYQPYPAAQMFAVLTMAAIAILIVAFIYRIFKKNVRSYGLFMVSVLAIVATLGYSLLLTSYSARYLLPLTGWVYISLCLFIVRIAYRRVIYAGLLLFAGIGCFALVTFRKYDIWNNNTRKGITGLVKYLQDKNVHYVFVSDGILQWQIAFYSKEQIVPRYYSETDRCPPYIALVDEALAQGKPTALVTHPDMLAQLPATTVRLGDYCVLTEPGRPLLQHLGFQLNP